MRNFSHLKYLIKLISVNVLILLVGLLILELIFGTWVRPIQMTRLNLKRNISGSYDASHLYGSEDNIVIYERDEFGFRGLYPGVDSIDILTMGGSTTDQRFITEGKTWQDILAQEFKSNGNDINVVNAGVDGQTTHGHIKNFDWWLPSIANLQVKYFLFYVGINDFHKTEDGFWYYRTVKSLPFYTPKLLPVFRTIEEHSALYNLGRTISGIRNARAANLTHRSINFEEVTWITDPNIHNHEDVMRERLSAYEDRLRTLGEKVEDFNAVPICVTQPLRIYKKEGGRVLGSTRTQEYEGGATINGVDYFYMMHLLNDTTLRVCKEIGGVPIDLANGVEWEDEDFYDSVHNTPKGTAKIGQYLHSELRDLFLQE